MRIFSKKLWLPLSVAFATLLVIAIIANTVIGMYYLQIDSFLNIPRYTLTGLDDSAVYYQAKYDTLESVTDRANEVCYNLEAEGLTLMKNDGALPLSSGAKVSLFGTGSVYVNSSAQGQRLASDKTDYPTFKDAFTRSGASVNETLWNFYTGTTYGGTLNNINEAPWSAFTSDIRSSFSNYGDAAIVVITRDSIEGSDVKVDGTAEDIANGTVGEDGTYLSLSVQERELLEELTQLKVSGTFDSVVVVLNTALCVSVDFLNDDSIDVDACMWIGNTGMSGVYAVADAIMGNVNPSGRLSDTYVYDNFSSPAAMQFGYTDGFSSGWDDSSLSGSQKYYGVYTEGMYVGYRYYETRYEDFVEGREGVGNYDYSADVAYPFGYGISYTAFEYSGFSVEESADGTSYDVSVTVTNTGGMAGKETVQIYLQKPYTEYDEDYMIEVPSVELVGYDKTAALEPGGSETVKINVSKEEFTSYDTYGAGTYILDAGDYYLATGTSAHDALNNILAAKGSTAEHGMDYDGDKSFAEKITVAEQDTKTYSVSGETGKEITNQLADLDPNRYTGGVDTVTYVSRSDWEGTMPEKAVTLTLTSTMKKDLDNLSLSDVESEGDKPQYGEDNGLVLINLRDKDYDDPEWELLLDEMTFDEQNTLISLGVSTQAVESIMKPATTESDGPTYVKDTAEGGKDSNSRFPCEGIWASTFNRSLLYDAGEILANDCILANIDGLWGVGVNIHRSPFGGRAHEYFSEDPFLTGNCAEQEIQGLQEYGVICCAKHFIFNDQEQNRNGVGVWVNEQAAREIYIEPWRYVASPSHGHSHGVMTSFNRAGCKWTSANYNLVTGILRDEFGFDGYVITDLASGNGATYMTALDGILAGTNIWLNYNTGEHSFDSYSNNATVTGLMRESCHRILYNIVNYSVAMNGISEETKMVPNTIWYEVLLTTLLVVFAVLTAGSAAMYGISKYRDWSSARSADAGNGESGDSGPGSGSNGALGTEGKE